MAEQYDDEYVTFVSQAFRELRRTAYLLCGDWHRAEDATQDALIRLYRRWSHVEPREGLLPYARRIVVRSLIDQGRRPWRREVSIETPPDVAVAAATGEVDDRLVLLKALGSLPPGRRACVVLRYYDELSVRETAHALGCSEGTVKSQTARAIDSLRQTVSDLDVAPLTTTREERNAS